MSVHLLMANPGLAMAAFGVGGLRPASSELKERPQMKHRSPYAQAMFDALAQGFYVPDVELVWFDKAAIKAGCRLESAGLFAYEGH